MLTNKTADIDDYITSFPKDIQKLLKQMRSTIRKAAPKAEEAMKYGIPTYIHNGNLVFFGGYKSHIGFYAAPTGHDAFKKELSKYKSGKGSVQFPIDRPLPLALVTRIVKFRVKENDAKVKAKKK